MSTVAPATPASNSVVERVFFPVKILLVAGAITIAPRLGVGLGLDPEPVFPWLMPTQLALPLAGVILLLWWLFFSQTAWLTRGIGLLLVAALGIGFFLSIRKFELTTTPIGLEPVFQFVWQRSSQDRYAEYRDQERNDTRPLPAIDATIADDDFPRYRGANSDGVIRHLQLQTDWQSHPPKLLWKRPAVEGYSGMAAAGNILVTLEHRDGQEALVCYDRATGRERWVHAYDALYKDRMNMGDGPRSTPTIHAKRIFSLGATGELHCVSADGKPLWRVNILDECKAKNIEWGLTGSPLIVGDLVVALAGIDPKHPAGMSLVAFEQATGKKRWAIGNRRAGYSSPQLATLAGKEQILLFDGEGLVSYDPLTLKELWSFPWVTKMDMNMIQPVVFSADRVFISAEPDDGCAMLHVKGPDKSNQAWSVEVVWKKKYFGARYANPVADERRIFGLHSTLGVLTCLDVEDGQRLWRGERFGPGQMLLVGDTLLVIDADGIASLFDPQAAEPKKLAQLAVLDPRPKTWNTPALAGNQLFVRNQAWIACWELPRR